MSFRTRIFLGLAAVVLLTAFMEAALDFLSVRAHQSLLARSERQVAAIAQTLANTIELRGEVPIRSGLESVTSPRFQTVRYRVLRNGAVIHGERRAFPEAGPAWAVAERRLMAGMQLQVALQRSPFERFLANDLLVDLADVPIFLGLAFLVSWLLARTIVRPVQQLTVASEQLSRQQFPKPLPVPPGEDEISRLTRSFNAMSESIHGYLERERTLTRYASHELRTPLAALGAQLERAQYGLSTPAEILPALDRNVRRMQDIVNALLSLARSSDRNQDPMPLAPLLRELLRNLTPAEQTRVELASTDDDVVVTDARLVQQAVSNLLDNALHYTEGPVELRAAATGKLLTIEVNDSGPGLPEEIIARPARPYKRRSGGGHNLGLGLSLVSQISAALGGSLELRNTGAGLKATLHLPVALAHDGLLPGGEAPAEDDREVPAHA